ncbi:MFS transporter [Acinetobacter sp. 1000160]|uniref:MFS transporter n=1 Tax=Acinetobacter sp. 1000160 TaxID=1310800 RepID=UPI00044AFED6|nr:MFS transporter [Acinetobacter sp. 1000160]EXB45748.1 sugar (and other) transporter family protein [Acinetobacter baumannii 146457]EYT16341.1 sugar (and other) transporter family protein [Acinetobacter sp. 1000160]
MNNDVQTVASSAMSKWPSNLGTYARITSHTWKFALLFAYFAMVVDGIDIMLLSYSLTSLKAEFGLSTFQAGALGSASLAGMGIGGILGGWACDKYGRVRTIAHSVTFFSVATCLLGFTQSFEQFMSLRFIGALGIGALYMACNTLMAEYVPTSYRTTVLGTLQTGQTVGYIVATLLAGAIIPEHGWRILFFITVIPAAINIILQRFVPEPKSWQLTKMKSLTPQTQQVITTQPQPKSQSIYQQIFANFKHRKMFLLWMTTAFFLQFGYYGINNWMPSYLEIEVNMNFKSLTSYMVGSYTAMILGKILAGYLADKFNRRAIFVFGTLASAIFLPIIIFFNTPDNILYLLITFGFLYGIPYGVNATYMAESFSTDVRGTAIGGAYNIGRVGAAIAPATIGFLASGGTFAMAFIVMGAAYFIAGVLPGLFIRDRQYDPQQS